MTDWKAIGRNLGEALAKLAPESAKARIRADYVKRFGKCRRCEGPLGGPSPDQVCEDCHANELLERAGGGKEPGDA